MKVNLLTTKTALCTYATAFAAFAGVWAPEVAPLAISIFDRHVPSETRRADIRDGIAIALKTISAIGVVSGGMGILVARYERGDTFTSRGLPGEDPPPL